MENPGRSIFTVAFSLLIIAAVFLSVCFSIDSSKGAYDAESLRTLEDSLTRAAVSCYAIEGCYPPNLEYLTDNYGVYIDESRFAVDYQIFASNILPEITVLAKGETDG